MDFLYGGAFRTGLPEAYERLILDAMLGDATLFTRADEVEEQWALVDAIVAAWRRDRPTFPNYAAGTWGPVERRRADPPRRPLAGGGTEHRACVAQVETRSWRELREQHAEGTPHERDDARRLGAAGVGRPPRADARRSRGAASVADDPALSRARRADGIDVDVDARSASRSPELEREVCSEVIELRLGGERDARARLDRRAAPASRPAGLLPLARPAAVGRAELEQLVDVVDRLIVDSTEWRGLPRAYRKLAPLFDRIAVSDIAWGRGARLARRGSRRSGRGSKTVKTLSVTGPKADALLLAGWLRSRLEQPVKLAHRSAAELERVAVDGEPVRAAARRGRRAPSDLLSAELDVFGRDPIYEAAVSAAR